MKRAPIGLAVLLVLPVVATMQLPVASSALAITRDAGPDREASQPSIGEVATDPKSDAGSKDDKKEPKGCVTFFGLKFCPPKS
jgi:hypothetical protein